MARNDNSINSILLTSNDFDFDPKLTRVVSFIISEQIWKLPEMILNITFQKNIDFKDICNIRELTFSLNSKNLNFNTKMSVIEAISLSSNDFQLKGLLAPFDAVSTLKTRYLGNNAKTVFRTLGFSQQIEDTSKVISDQYQINESGKDAFLKSCLNLSTYEYWSVSRCKINLSKPLTLKKFYPLSNYEQSKRLQQWECKIKLGSDYGVGKNYYVFNKKDGASKKSFLNTVTNMRVNNPIYTLEGSVSDDYPLVLGDFMKNEYSQYPVDYWQVLGNVMSFTQNLITTKVTLGGFKN